MNSCASVTRCIHSPFLHDLPSVQILFCFVFVVFAFSGVGGEWLLGGGGIFLLLLIK